MLRYERVLIGKGKKAHLRYDENYSVCGLGPVDNSKSTIGYPLCKRCEKLAIKAGDRSVD